MNIILLKVRKVARESKFFRMLVIAGAFMIGAIIFARYALDKKTEYLNFACSAGDLIFVCAFSSEYIKRSAYKQHRCIVKRCQKDLFESLNKLKELDNPVVISNLSAAFLQPFLCYAKLKNMPWLSSIPGLLGYNKTHQPKSSNHGMKQIRLNMRLPLDAKFVPPEYPIVSEFERAELCKKHKIAEGRAVVLAPYTWTFFEYDFVPVFEAFAHELSAQGYTVFTNTTDERCISGTTPISLPMIEMVTLCEVIGRVISARSGFCDFLSFANCDLTILYPTEYSLEIFTFSKMPETTNPKIKEVIINPNELEKLPSLAEIEALAV